MTKDQPTFSEQIKQICQKLRTVINDRQYDKVMNNITIRPHNSLAGSGEKRTPTMMQGDLKRVIDRLERVPTQPEHLNLRSDEFKAATSDLANIIRSLELTRNEAGSRAEKILNAADEQMDTRGGTFHPKEVRLIAAMQAVSSSERQKISLIPILDATLSELNEIGEKNGLQTYSPSRPEAVVRAGLVSLLSSNEAKTLMDDLSNEKHPDNRPRQMMLAEAESPNGNLEVVHRIASNQIGQLLERGDSPLKDILRQVNRLAQSVQR